MRSEATRRRVFPGLYSCDTRQTVSILKTDKIADKKSVSKTREIRDNVVLKYCTDQIAYYTHRLNSQDTSQWSIKEIVAFLSTEETDASFSDYAKLHISRMENEGHQRNAKNYKMAVQHF